MTKLTRIEEVLKYLELGSWVGFALDWQYITSDEAGLLLADFACQICQLFPQPLDDKGLRYKANDLLVNCSTHFDNDQLEAALDVFDQILALLPSIEEAKRQVIDMLKNYGVSITNEGVLVPYSDEWDYLHDTPRRTLLRGNDKGESCKKWWEALKGGE